MVRGQWERAMSRAIVDLGFRVRLLADPVDALADYGLGEHEREVVEALHARSLTEFISCFLNLGMLTWAHETSTHRWEGDIG